MRSLRDASRAITSQRSEMVSSDELTNGSLQRIADACELMAKSYRSLIDERNVALADLERYKGYLRSCESANRHLHKRINAYKGTVTRMKKGASRG